MDLNIEKSWKNVLKEEFKKDYFTQLEIFVNHEYNNKKIFPSKDLIFNAFYHTPFNQVKAVILGQDPYHGDGQANGLSFSVNEGIKIPPSLVNIFKEINKDAGSDIPKSGDLTRWADQGVLLLNATLTVEAHKAGSHQKKGWEKFTDTAIRKIAEEREHIVFILWGAYAQKKAAFIDGNKHLVLSSVHPSPLSAYNGFFGNNHFTRTNEFLISKGLTPISW